MKKHGEKRINLKFTVAYDGTGFAGFQRQAAGERTVQGVLEDAFYKLTGEYPKLIAAGRTDAGVHAYGQVINVLTNSGIPVDRWLAALNSKLPQDVVAWQVERVLEEFHARYHAKSKVYQYRVLCRSWPDVLRRNYCLHYPYELDLEPMRKAAAYFRGQNDFAAFAAAGSPVKSTVRNLMRLDITEKGDELIITLKADGFLYKMARNIVGTLLLAGRGKMTPDEVRLVLQEKKRAAAGPPAPPHGLCLVRVDYPPVSVYRSKE
ncbi:MAG TPA: tRNA pseudouridine(38-40) synthase TruA [Firmicutes bacterium]|jgi:tRNA pseudouridine38-40 synthase|nr:tRNA pseudouridine(38-40) synthase TruA [Bacillota bacterium]